MYNYLVQHVSSRHYTKYDTTGVEGIPTEVKILVCLRIFATERSLQDIKDQAEMYRGRVRTCLRDFKKDFINIHGENFRVTDKRERI